MKPLNKDPLKCVTSERGSLRSDIVEYIRFLLREVAYGGYDAQSEILRTEIRVSALLSE
jgi:hypothetical protein